MITYASSHSKTEKKYFDQFGYPGNNQHKKEHASFTKEIADFKINFDTGKIRLSIEIMDFLSNWLQKHIKGIDEKYVPFFTNIGLNHKGKILCLWIRAQSKGRLHALFGAAVPFSLFL